MSTRNGQAKLDTINAALDAGATIYLSTSTRHTKITRATREKFAAAGHPVLKVDSAGSLWLASGRRYVCADLCRITREG